MNPRRLATIAIVPLLLALAGCSLITTGPIAAFDVEPVVIYAGETVRLDASPSSGRRSIVSYTWDLGDGRAASGKEVTTSFQSPGRYTITLTVEDVTGRRDEAEEGIIVYLRSGTEIFHEGFSSGEPALGDWPLDPTWASPDEGAVEYVESGPGYALHIRSTNESWHRRYAALSLPPLRGGQKVVFSCRVMTLQNQDHSTFIIVPLRREVGSSAGSSPYYRFTSDGGGSYVQEPTAYGTDVGHPIGFKPGVYNWHTYSFSYTSSGYEFEVDGTVWRSGPLNVDITEGGDWLILIGEESASESCNAYYDDIVVRIEE